MEFGSLPPEALNDVNFQLPPDTTFNHQVLNRQSSLKNSRVYIGCGKWGRKDWIGKIFPPGTKEKDFLNLYVSQFNSIELNATAYRIYGPATISSWGAEATGKDFLFCPKFPQIISQSKDLTSEHVQGLTNKFLAGISAFNGNLGPLFIQFNERFSPAKKSILYNFLETLPTRLEVFVEVRHPEWYSDTATAAEYFDTLRKCNKGAVITDVAGRRDCAHMQLPVDKAFVRFVGNHLHPTDFSRLDEWVERINTWGEKGLSALYFFMHHPEEKESPELCDYLIEQLNKRCNTTLKRPALLSPYTTG